MKIHLADRESFVIFGKRIINDTGRPIGLVVLDEPGESIQIDRRPYPKKANKATANAMMRSPRPASV
ncbi:hypothetical protein DTL21_10920 [Bremerella cremea]|uniref:Uncharacterized protein n=1 Tax=Blastopirellula marina TaxID=124 RepID=A0A2S8FT21_9BACT|nr:MULTISPECIES: hypothetical protein [Pirellulaceae]PQO35329.1 hypothetical protein C5Y83_10915 [Blastopirellula marina]RCS48279.1 hypothetical protein DTL21_10920 [Bremerella cremea]